MAGVKAHDQCLEEHDFKYEWPAWMHETGIGYGYSCVSDSLAWSDSETMRGQGKACVSVWATQVNPHRMSEPAHSGSRTWT